mmetsp:Transcript_50009/g.143979  ORF Transcript_50009/g.143979 Transcript_50009/m.143979 type:complete len:385 (+) Transcript_50009:1195-2349(+)
MIVTSRSSCKMSANLFETSDFGMIRNMQSPRSLWCATYNAPRPVSKIIEPTEKGPTPDTACVLSSLLTGTDLSSAGRSRHRPGNCRMILRKVFCILLASDCFKPSSSWSKTSFTRRSMNTERDADVSTVCGDNLSPATKQTTSSAPTSRRVAWLAATLRQMRMHVSTETSSAKLAPPTFGTYPCCAIVAIEGHPAKGTNITTITGGTFGVTCRLAKMRLASSLPSPKESTIRQTAPSVLSPLNSSARLNSRGRLNSRKPKSLNAGESNSGCAMVQRISLAIGLIGSKARLTIRWAWPTTASVPRFCSKAAKSGNWARIPWLESLPSATGAQLARLAPARLDPVLLLDDGVIRCLAIAGSVRCALCSHKCDKRSSARCAEAQVPN